jgi:Tfp pilus assembly protein PilV
MTGPDRRGEQGASMLELVVAMFFLSLALIGLAAVFPVAMHGVAMGGYQTTATLLGQQTVEIAASKPYDALPAMATAGFVAVPGFPGFTRAITIETGTPSGTSTTITVAVRFTAIGTSTETTLATIRAQ